MVTSSLAIDYWLGKGLGDTFYFHLSMVISFLIQGILMYFLYLKIFDVAEDKTAHNLTALIAVAGYLLHPANAETINYIISRSDSFSAMFIVLSLVLYVRSSLCRSWHLYLVPVALGMLTKPIVAVFPLLLLVYLFLFEEKASLTDLISRKGLGSLYAALRKTAPALIFIVGMLIFLKMMEPPTWVAGGNSTFRYVITQPYVVLKYCLSFFLPVFLSADTDLKPLASIADSRFFVGIIFLASLLLIAIRSSKKETLRPISFGILWFIITLVPTSLIPLAEVMNDHRVFLPYVGLMISVSWGVNLLLRRFRHQFSARILYNTAVTSVLAIFLLAGCYGTHRRNEVWRSEETLWHDVVEKSPQNGRGLMNYGVVLMEKADYTGAEKYFLQALVLTPNYGRLHTNLGVLHAAIGNTAQAEEYFRKAVSLQPQDPLPYFYYAGFLKKRSRYPEAITNLEKTLALYAANMDARSLLMETYLKLGDFRKATGIAAETLRLAPGDKQATMYLTAINSGSSKAEITAAAESTPGTPEYYLNLSLGYYQGGEFAKCITAAQSALQLKPNYDLALNNLCAADNSIQQWDKAIKAGEQAIQLNPANQLARNNLAWAKNQKTTR